MAGIGGIGGPGLDLTAFTSALARTNGVKYTGDGSLNVLAGLQGTAPEGLSADGIGADALGLSGAELGLARSSGGATTASAAGSSFEDALLKAIDGVNADQQKTSGLIQKMVASPDSVNAHDVTIAMAESNLSLNLARTILDRIVRGWKEVINTR